jgi:hypothetical protein
MQTNRSRSGLLQAGIIILTIATALIHFTRNFPDPMFILNGLGYVGLLAALYLPLPIARDHRRTVRYILMGYTALTILLWVVMGAREPIGYIDKIIEVALLGLLWLEASQTRPVGLRKNQVA